MIIGAPDSDKVAYELWWTMGGCSWLLYSLDSYEAAKIAYINMDREAREHVTAVQVSRRTVGQAWDQ